MTDRELALRVRAADKLPFEKFIEVFVKTPEFLSYSKNTRSIYLGYFRSFCKYLKETDTKNLTQITAETISSFHSKIDSTSRRQGSYSAIRSFFEWAAIENLVNPDRNLGNIKMHSNKWIV